MKTLEPESILFEDNHLIAVNKPAGIAVQNSGQDTTLPELIKRYLKDSTDNHKENPWLGILHRLDQNVSGVNIFAKNSKSASRVSQMIRERSVGKIYIALLNGSLKSDEGTLIHYHIKSHARARIYEKPIPESKKATLKFKNLKSFKDKTLVLIKLDSGLYHQIRAQFAFIQNPIKGDLKYDPRNTKSPSNLFLHHIRMILKHPVSKEELSFFAKPPAYFMPYLTSDDIKKIMLESARFS